MKTILIAISVIFLFNGLLAQNIGINTHNPEKSLDVYGTSQIKAGSSSTDATLDLIDTLDGFSRLKFSRPISISDNYWILAGRGEEGGDDNSRFNLFYNGDSQAGNVMIAKGNGKVGFGVSPIDRLHLNAQGSENPFWIQVNGSTKFRVLNNGGTTIGINNTGGTPSNGLYVNGNTGLGVSNPDDKLEVDGDVNIQGQIKASDVVGQPGQLLTPNTMGGMDWVDPCGYKYFIDFWKTGSLDWTVPAGVTQVMVELWGAGGGGALGGGGGSGAYVKAIFEVTPGQVLTTFVGAGGNGVSGGSTGSGSTGGSSSITSSGFNIIAGGGAGANSTSPGTGGTFSSSALVSRMIRNGNKGGRNVSIPPFSGYEKIDFGKGGKAPFTQETGGEGEVWHRSTGAGAYNIVQGTTGIQPGGGGGGGNINNNFGGDGYIIIRW